MESYVWHYFVSYTSLLVSDAGLVGKNYPGRRIKFAARAGAGPDSHRANWTWYGGVLLIVTIGLLCIAWGYLYRIFVDALNGTESLNLPSWSNWWAYGVAGFWLFLIVLGYSVIGVAGFVMLVSVLGLIPGSVEEAGAPALLLLFTVIFFYGFFPVVFTRFAAEGRVWMAFEPGPVWRDLRQVVRLDYVQACFGLFGISLLGSLILGQLSLVGVVLASVFNFLLLVVFTRVLGLLIRRALKPGPPAQRESWN